MSSIKIKNLPEKTTSLDDNDLMIIEDTEDTKKISLIKLRTGFSIDGILNSVKQSLLDNIDSFMQKHNTRYQNLLERNDNLEVICHNLQNDHDHDAERIFELEDRLVVQENLVSNLQIEKDKLSQSIYQLQIDKDALSEKIVDLKNQVVDNESKITILKSQVKDLQLKNTEIKQLNEDLQNKLNELQKPTLEDINNHFAEVDSKLTETIDDLLAYIKFYHPDVEDAFSDIYQDGN